MKPEKIRDVMVAMEDRIRSEEFETWRSSFVNEHVDVFTFDDENKLEYTDIHRKYEAKIEEFMVSALPPECPVEEFMAQLPGFLEGPGAKDEAIGKAATTLLEASDFEQFRNMMLFTKKEREQAGPNSEQLLNGVSINSAQADGKSLGVDHAALMDMCAQLARSNDASGWEECLKLDWMRIDRRPVEADRRRSPSDIYLRGVWTMNLSFVECVDMMFNLSDLRKEWDPNYSGVRFPFGGDWYGSDTVVTSVDVDFGYLMNLVMNGGRPFTLTCKNYRRWDVPSAGSVTFAMVPWDLARNDVDRNHKMLSIKTGTIEPHPTLPDKVVMTTLECNTMGGMPSWALHWMLRATAPSMMRNMESRYIANVRAKGLTTDLTPAGIKAGTRPQTKVAPNKSSSCSVS